MKKGLKVSHRHLQILEIFANHPSTTNAEIAHSLNISLVNVRNTLKNMRDLKLITHRVGYDVNISFVNSHGITVVPVSLWNSDQQHLPPDNGSNNEMGRL